MDADNIVLEHLRAIHEALGRLSDNVREIKGHLGALEAQYASLSNRLDDRVARIERRLDLQDA